MTLHDRKVYSHYYLLDNNNATLTKPANSSPDPHMSLIANLLQDDALLPLLSHRLAIQLLQGGLSQG